MTAALDGIRVVDLTRLAPGPYASMLLGDMGADVILVEPLAAKATPDRTAQYFALGRNKRSICVDLKHADGVAVFRDLAGRADVVLEGFRPGVVARLGIDDAALRPDNPRLVYCSLSGFGQTGPYAQMAGHDVDYAAIGGALGMIGRPGSPPAIPMNLVADYAGGGLLAAFAIVTALYSREKSGKGQYIDVAMTDGVLSLLTKLVGQYLEKGSVPGPGAHRINGGYPDYDVYECGDGRFIAIGALEPHLFRNLCTALGVPEWVDHQLDPAKHREMRAAFETRFKSKPRDEWFTLLRAADACAAPVYTLDEAIDDPHHLARGMIVETDGLRQVGVAPKFDGTPGSIRRPPPLPGQDTDGILTELGRDAATIAALRSARVVA